MEQIHRSSIEADNRLKSLETDSKRLDIYHNMLNVSGPSAAAA